MHGLLDEAIRAAGLSAHAARIKARARRAYSLLTRPVADDDEIDTGRSKLGGSPDVPAGFDWPMWREEPLAFIAQINLAEVAEHGRDPDLPADGMMSFFYECSGEAWGFDPADRGSAAVRYTPATHPLIRTRAPMVRRPKVPLLKRLFRMPLLVAGVFRPCVIEFKAIASLPPQLGVEVENDIDEAYWALTERLHATDMEGKEHRFLGYPTEVQHEMEDQCELVTNGLYCGDGRAYRTPEAQRLLATPHDWMLLMQVDSDDDAGMMWGDAGMIYFWIRRQDLKTMRLDRAWCILQCC